MERSSSPISSKEMSLKRKTSIEIPIVNNKLKNETKAEASKVLDGKPNKKIIKLSELMTNMDPLEYFKRFLGIPEMIFRHFKGKDLIEISEVSPSYYDFIASSKILMKDIKVVFDDKRMLETFFKHLKAEDLINISPHQTGYNIITSSKVQMKLNKIHSEDHSLLKNSSRLYQNIEIKRTSPNMEDGNLKKFGNYVTSSELNFFCSKAHEWRNVSLDNVYFRKKLDMWRFLSAIEASVESISVTDFGALSFEDPLSVIESFEELKFPKLKQLKMHHKAINSFGDTLVRFFLNSVAIEELVLIDSSGKICNHVLTKMLINFDKVTSLTIDLKHVNLIFWGKSWKQFQFKLKSASIAYFECDNLGTNFRNFLKSQNDYLEKLRLRTDGLDRKTFDAIMKLPKLKNFSLKCSYDFPEDEVSVNIISTSITELTLYYYADAVTLKFLLDSMPEISHLTLDSIDEEDFKMLKSMKRKFEKLKVCKLRRVNRKEMEEIMIENYTSLEIVNFELK